MKIYLRLTTSRSFLLYGGLALSLFYGMCVMLLWAVNPYHPAMFAVIPICMFCIGCTLSFLFFSNFPYIIISCMAFSIFISPVVMCLIAMVLTSVSGSQFAILIPYVILSYNIVVTALEYFRIDFQSLPAGMTRRMFSKSGGGALFFNPHVSVLFLSPWRSDDSFFFSGPIRHLQKLLVIFMFIYMMVFFAMKVRPDGAQDVWPAFGVLLALAALVMQPYLLQHLIRLRLVWMKSRGQI